jgi:LysM repeat protein
MADITEIAVASWRLEKWLDNVNVERKMAAKSALRAIKKYLSENSIEVIDLTGSKFDVGLAVSVVNNESDETDEDKLIISEMVKPIIKENGAVIQYGQVILGDEVKKPKENNVVEAAPPPEVTEAEKKVVEIAETISDTPDNVQSENAAEEVVKRKEDEKPKSHSLLGICVVGLQIVLIAIGMILLVRVGNVLSVNEQLLAGNSSTPPEVSKEETIDLSGIENNLSDIDERLETVEGDISELLEKYSVIEKSITRQETTVSDDDYIVYVVQPGDTLFKICQENNIDFYANRALILRMNYMDDANYLTIGQKLLLPKE